MIKEFLQQKKELSLGVGKEKVVKKQSWGEMDHPELSLGPSLSTFTDSANSSSSESEVNPCRKRKHTWDEHLTQTSIELQLNDPLPLDWEQCLDLQSGRMYYLNRKTLKKSWARPKDQKLDLDLNISTLPSSDGKSDSSTPEDSKIQNNSGSSMVAVACLRCHLLVMLSKSSPSCPNCKYLHSLPTQQAPPRRIEHMKTLETLSLLN